MNLADVLNEIDKLSLDNTLSIEQYRDEVQSIIDKYHKSIYDWHWQDEEAIEELTDGLLKIAETFDVKIMKAFANTYSRDFEDAPDHLAFSIKFNVITVDDEQRIIDILNSCGGKAGWTYRLVKPREEWKDLPNIEPIMYIHTALQPIYVERVNKILDIKIDKQIEYYEQFERKLA